MPRCRSFPKSAECGQSSNVPTPGRAGYVSACSIGLFARDHGGEPSFGISILRRRHPQPFGVEAYTGQRLGWPGIGRSISAEVQWSQSGLSELWNDIVELRNRQRAEGPAGDRRRIGLLANLQRRGFCSGLVGIVNSPNNPVGAPPKSRTQTCM
jgi:hypothetical protein